MLYDIGSPVVLGMGPNPSACFASEDKNGLGSIIWVDVTDLKGWRVDYVERLQSIEDSSSTCQVQSLDDVAYLIYTSGSTGKPKGVLVPHRAAVTCIESFATRQSHLSTGTDLRWFVMCSPSFDIFILEMFLTLSLGGTLCVAERQLMLTDTEAAINALRANTTFSVPSLAMLFRPDRMPTLKTLVCGGEMLTQRVVENFAPATGTVSDRELINLWGPAETAIANTTVRCNTKTCVTNIGEPFPTSRLFMLDADSTEPKELPLGMTGELALGGPQVSLGYLKRPEETAKSFIDSQELGRIYRTGDKGRIVWAEDGTPSIAIVGRISMGQVKLNGRRVELGEIEAVLAQADTLAEVAVVVSGVRLVACIVPLLKVPSSYHEFETRCRSKAEKHLPEWMRPTEYLVMQELSRSIAGRKLDRKSLAAMVASMSVEEDADENTDSGYSDGDIDPSDISAIIYNGLAAAIGRNVLQSDGATPLFSLGFHSLRAMVFLQSVREYGIQELKVQDLLSGVTINEVVQLVQERRKVLDKNLAIESREMQMSKDHHGEVDSEELLEYPVQTRLQHFDTHCRTHCLQALGNLRAEDIEEVLPTVSMQNHFLVGYLQFCRDSRQGLAKPFIEHFVYELPLSWELTRLQWAIERVIRRHDMFRTVFVEVDHPLAPFAQCILAPSSPRTAIPHVEIVVRQYSKDPDSLWQLTIENAQRSAETAIRMDRPGYVVSYVRTENRSHAVFILSIFHPIFDGVSLTLVRSEIADEYLRDDKEDSPGTVQRSMRRLVEKNLETDWFGSRFYWMKRFAGKPNFRTGPRCPATISRRPLNSTYASKMAKNMEGQGLLLDISMDDLTAVAASILSTTPMAVIQAAWTMVLARTRITEQPRAIQEAVKLDVQFGSVLHGRHDIEALRCVAPMLATVAMSVELDDIYSTHNLPSNREICQRIARQHAETIPYQQIPCPTLDMIETQLRFDSILNVQTYSDSNYGDLPGLNWQENRLQSYQESDNGFPILMEVWPGWGSTDKPVYLKCTYNTEWPDYEFLTAEWVQGLLVAFKEAITNIVEAPDAAFRVVTT